MLYLLTLQLLWSVIALCICALYIWREVPVRTALNFMSSHVLTWGILWVNTNNTAEMDSLRKLGTRCFSLRSPKNAWFWLFFPNKKDKSGNNSCQKYKLLMFAIVLSRKQDSWQNINPTIDLYPDHMWLAFNNLLKHEQLTLSTETLLIPCLSRTCK